MKKKERDQSDRRGSGGVRNRIRELKNIRVADLQANPLNWRAHPEAQRTAMSAVLAEVGMVDALLVREAEGGQYEIIDGHMRAALLPHDEVPCLVLDVTPEEATKVLLTFDPLAAMAEANAANLDALLREVEFGEAALQELVAGLAEDADLYNVDEIAPPELADGDRQPFRQMTFTVHDSQYETIEAALTKSKARGYGVSDCNENSNGNALAAICEAFNG